MTATSPISFAMKSPFYHHEAMDAYECLGCGDMLEVPRTAVLRMGQRPEAVRANPENRQIWLEMHELVHGKCHKFSDLEKARQYRESGAGIRVLRVDRVATARAQMAAAGW